MLAFENLELVYPHLQVWTAADYRAVKSLMGLYLDTEASKAKVFNVLKTWEYLKLGFEDAVQDQHRQKRKAEEELGAIRAAKKGFTVMRRPWNAEPAAVTSTAATSTQSQPPASD